MTLASACATPAPAQAPPSVQIAPAPSASAAAAPPSELVSVAAVRPPQKLVLDGDVSEWGSLLPPKPRPKPAPQTGKGKPKAPPEEIVTVTNRWPPLDPGAPARKTAERAKARAEANAKGQTKEEAHEAAVAEEQEDALAQILLESSTEPPPDLSTTGSHLGAALTNDAALIAAELASPAPDGIWLGIGSLPPELPVPGELMRSGASFEELKCTANRREFTDGMYIDSGEPNPPEVIAACRALLDTYAKVKIEHDARFTRVFKIDREGARAVAADGKLTAIASAKVAWKKGANGASFELSLPLAALPRVAEAPLAKLVLVARVATTPTPPELGPEQWVAVSLPDAVSFEPFGELRARVWTLMNEGGYGGQFRPPAGLSYQPGEALKVSSALFAGDSVLPVDEVLYTKEATLADVEVGRVDAGSRLVAIFKKGKVVDVLMPPGSPRGVIQRDGEIHLLSYTERTWNGGMLFTPPSWSVLAIDAGGTVRDPLEEEEDAKDGFDCHSFDDPVEIASKELDSFGFRGACYLGPKKTVGVESLFRWDPAKRKYTGGKWRRVTLPKKAAKKKK